MVKGSGPTAEVVPVSSEKSTRTNKLVTHQKVSQAKKKNASPRKLKKHMLAAKYDPSKEYNENSNHSKKPSQKSNCSNEKEGPKAYSSTSYNLRSKSDNYSTAGVSHYSSSNRNESTFKKEGLKTYSSTLYSYETKSNDYSAASGSYNYSPSKDSRDNGVNISGNVSDVNVKKKASKKYRSTLCSQGPKSNKRPTTCTSYNYSASNYSRDRNLDISKNLRYGNTVQKKESKTCLSTSYSHESKSGNYSTASTSYYYYPSNNSKYSRRKISNKFKDESTVKSEAPKTYSSIATSLESKSSNSFPGSASCVSSSNNFKDNPVNVSNKSRNARKTKKKALKTYSSTSYNHEPKYEKYSTTSASYNCSSNNSKDCDINISSTSSNVNNVKKTYASVLCSNGPKSPKDSAVNISNKLKNEGTVKEEESKTYSSTLRSHKSKSSNYSTAKASYNFTRANNSKDYAVNISNKLKDEGTVKKEESRTYSSTSCSNKSKSSNYFTASASSNVSSSANLKNSHLNISNKSSNISKTKKKTPKTYMPTSCSCGPNCSMANGNCNSLSNNKAISENIYNSSSSVSPGKNGASKTDGAYIINTSYKTDNVTQLKDSVNMEKSKSWTSDLGSIFVEKVEIIPINIENNLNWLIMQYSEGIWCSEIPEIYKKMFHQELNHEKLGFKSLIQLCNCLPSVSLLSSCFGDFLLLYEKQLLPKCAERISYTSNYIYNSNSSLLEAELVDVTNLLPPDILKRGETIPRSFCTEIVQAGDEICIVMGEIYDLSKFWICLKDLSFEAMKHNMQDFYKENTDKYQIPNQMIEVGLYCVQMVMGEFQRALIVSTMPEVPDAVRVFFIDFGTTMKVSTKGLCFLHIKFSHFPAQAISCRMANVVPPVQGALWSKEACEAFRRLTTQTDLVVKVKRIDLEELFLEVYLADISDKDNILYINRRLIEEGHAQDPSKERPRNNVNPLYKALFKDIHLYPTFFEIEHGLAPSRGDMELCHTLNIPVNFCYPQYFRIDYTEEKRVIWAAENFHERHEANKNQLCLKTFKVDRFKAKKPNLMIFGDLESDIRDFVRENQQEILANHRDLFLGDMDAYLQVDTTEINLDHPFIDNSDEDGDQLSDCSSCSIYIGSTVSEEEDCKQDVPLCMEDSIEDVWEVGFGHIHDPEGNTVQYMKNHYYTFPQTWPEMDYVPWSLGYDELYESVKANNFYANNLEQSVPQTACRLYLIPPPPGFAPLSISNYGQNNWYPGQDVPMDLRVGNAAPWQHSPIYQERQNVSIPKITLDSINNASFK